MFSTRFITAAAASLSLIASSTATYDANSRANMAVYWGQGGVGPGGPSNPYAQLPLMDYCNDPAIDIIPVAFITLFPPQANGLVQENYADKCQGGNIYPGLGYDGVNNPNNNLLWEICPDVQQDIWYCQTQTSTKILLSLGGSVGVGVTPYELNSEADGVYLANLLWGMYGPIDQGFNADWVSSGSYRPLDRGTNNATAGITVDIDGFDFDIEVGSTNEQAGYVAAIGQLRTLYAAYKVKNPCAKDYLISGSPQCTDLLIPPYSNNLGPAGLTNMGTMINEAVFDILWIQFYNNDAYNNNAYGCSARNAINGTFNNFNYNAWTTFIAQSASKNARLYLGLLGSTWAGTADDYLYIYEAQLLISDFVGTGNFGGVMLWDATYATNNIPTDKGVSPALQGDNYYQVLNNFLKDYSPASYTAVTTPVQSKCSTTSSVSSTTTSTTSSSSSSAAATTTSTTSSTPTPTSVPWVVNSQGQNCTLNGCFTEGNGVRALSGATYVSVAYYLTMTVEMCSNLCANQGFDLFGVEYGGECYCGNQLACGSVSAPLSDCSMPCGGAPDEYCGAGNRLDVYQCGSVPASNGICSTSSTSTTSTTTSSSAPTTSSTSTTTTSSSSSSTTSSTSTTSTTSSSSTSSTSSMTSSSSSTSSTTSSTSTTSPTTSSTSTTSTTSSSSSSAAATTTCSSTSSTTTSSTSTSSTSSSSSSSSAAATTSISSTSSSTSSSSSSSVATSSSSSSTSSVSSSSTGSSSPTSSTSTNSGTVTSSSSSSSTTGPTSSSVVSGTVTSTSTSSSSTSYTTSTVITTSVYTVTSCASTVTNCPVGHVTTDIITLYTTICPVTETQTSAPATSTTATSTTAYTTSTVYTTTVYTVTSCAPTVTNCPAKLGSVTTEVISLYTTVCPVTATETASASSSLSTTTISSTTTNYVTVKVVKSTATLVPYPSGSSSGSPFGTGSPSVSLVIQKVTSTAQGAATSAPIKFTGAASSVRGGMGVMIAIVVGAMALMI